VRATISIVLLLGVILAAGSWLATCAADDGGGGESDADSDTDSGGDTDTDTSTDVDPDTDTGFEECSEMSISAQNSLTPVDIIIAVDNSGSMTAEAEFVQENMNDFSQQIVDSGVDAHIVLISSPNDVSTNGICVDAPLGSGSCPDDTNMPNYLHVPWPVSSVDALMQIRDSYETWWDDMLREDSVRHFVVVSDDNSWLPALEFIDDMAELDPPMEEFLSHAIASPMDVATACAMDPPHPCCYFAASMGTVYLELAALTEGIFADLCSQDFGPVFDELAEVVTDVPISCEWVIPDPPDDEVFDPEMVNVDYIDEEDVVHPIGHVNSADDCDDVSHAWYYDDPDDPETIKVCPQTCFWIQSSPDATIVIKFGCETEEALE
jgi:hypothetical protein